MLYPKKVKYRRKHRGTLKGKANRGVTLEYGNYGIKAMSKGYLTSRQIEAARRTIRRHLKKEGKLWIRIFPDKPYTYKGVEVAMGGGKGMVDHYETPIRPGRVLFEIDGVPKKVAKNALERASHKLPVKTKFITQENQLQ